MALAFIGLILVTLGVFADRFDGLTGRAIGDKWTDVPLDDCMGAADRACRDASANRSTSKRLQSPLYGEVEIVSRAGERALSERVVARAPDGSERMLLATSEPLRDLVALDGGLMVVSDRSLWITQGPTVNWRKSDMPGRLVTASWCGEKRYVAALESGEVMWTTDGSQWWGPQRAVHPDDEIAAVRCDGSSLWVNCRYGHVLRYEFGSTGLATMAVSEAAAPGLLPGRGSAAVAAPGVERVGS
ncbi:MAG: hypothetical protein HYV63_07340 [Candidatus Schekmanbacteria bacterium]|nr:hypothetical protein [Candidatus Schekmanbacteria bacterium]